MILYCLHDAVFMMAAISCEQFSSQSELSSLV